MRCGIRRIVVVLAVVSLLGCEQPEEQASVGIVAQPSDELRVGDRAPDFDSYSATGERRRFSDIRGDVTILALTHAPDPEVCSVAANILMLAEKYADLKTNVRFVCVSAPAGDQCDLKANIAEKCGLQSLRVVGLCDAGGRVRDLFRAGKGQVYFVIDGDGRIVAKGPIDDLRGMEAALRKAVRAYEADLPGPYDDN
ncbi:MAG: redoxin domain-containing protein [Planctomycetota bacterium]